jgi:hypothetical protein
MPLYLVFVGIFILAPAVTKISDAIGNRIARVIDPEPRPETPTMKSSGRTFDQDGIEIPTPPRPMRSAA